MVVLIKWLAHASFQIKGGEKVVYIDLARGEASDKADLILVTHSHSDHCNRSQIQKVRKKDTVIIAPNDCASEIGGKVETLEPGEEATLGGITVKAVNAYNIRRFRSPRIPYHPKDFGVGYLITIENKTIYHAGDTDFIPEMQQLGHVDVALLPSGDTYTMDNTEAAEAAIAINPKSVIPMHRWSTKPKKFKTKVETASNINVVLLQEGDEFEVT